MRTWAVRAEVICVVLAAEFLLGCSRTPKTYPPPWQLPFVALERTNFTFVEMNNPFVWDYVVQDISETLEGGAWRWTYEHPTLRFSLPQRTGLRVAFELSMPEAILQADGPKTIRFFVGDHQVGVIQVKKPGGVKWEAPVLPEWIEPGKPIEISATTTPIYAPKRDMRHLGFILVGAGFRN